MIITGLHLDTVPYLADSKDTSGLNIAFFVEKRLCAVWDDETSWGPMGRILKYKFYVIDSDLFDDIETTQHVDKVKLIISRVSPKWALYDAEYSKIKPDADPCVSRKVWSMFTISGSNLPIWNSVREMDMNPLIEENSLYLMSTIQSAMCENK